MGRRFTTLHGIFTRSNTAHHRIDSVCQDENRSSVHPLHHCGFWDRGTFTDFVPFLGGGALYHFIFFFDPLFILRVISQSATTSFGTVNVNVFQGAPSFCLKIIQCRSLFSPAFYASRKPRLQAGVLMFVPGHDWSEEVCFRRKTVDCKHSGGIGTREHCTRLFINGSF